MRWDVFVSHASEDKESVAIPLAEALTARGLRVWLDRHELKIGDSLRQSIDEGLAKSRFGVVVLSEAFFDKRWSVRELNGLVAVESLGVKAILPVWHGIDHATLVKHSPMLADRVAGNTANGIEPLATAITTLVLAEPGGTPAVDTPTVGGRLLDLVCRDDRAALEEFLALHPTILRNAFGRSWTEVRRGVKIEDTGIELCVGSFQLTPRTWRWRGVILGSPSASPVDRHGTVSEKLHDLATLTARVRSAPSRYGPLRHLEASPHLRPRLPDFRPADFELTAVTGRRGTLGTEQAAALAEFNDLHHGFRVRTYDWLIDAAMDLT
ncbi:toll/interleukin-1 receptor domain-containing protein [Streptomyces sp. NPDC086080]|uniref:toll/interleukin-1 receptor domain-containing protein n=1 Tax=Streptomyces sp. NPDC086080 TaxID=3365748 RepID=UPI0037CF357B